MIGWLGEFKKSLRNRNAFRGNRIFEVWFYGTSSLNICYGSCSMRNWTWSVFFRGGSMRSGVRQRDVQARSRAVSGLWIPGSRFSSAVVLLWLQVHLCFRHHGREGVARTRRCENNLPICGDKHRDEAQGAWSLSSTGTTTRNRQCDTKLEEAWRYEVP